MSHKTELDALLDRIREDKADPTGKNRNAVAYDCWRMFENLATRYKEEFASRDRYKAQSNSWREVALRHTDYKGIAEHVVNWLADQTYQNEPLLHAVVCCDFVSRQHFIDSIARRIEEKSRESEPAPYDGEGQPEL